jgi:hypothetical protein
VTDALAYRQAVADADWEFRRAILAADVDHHLWGYCRKHCLERAAAFFFANPSSRLDIRSWIPVEVERWKRNTQRAVSHGILQ